MSDKKTDGVIMFFLNYNPDIDGVTLRDQVDLFKELNSDFISSIEAETNYRVAIIPTTKEACRVEKMDFEHPFPRFIPNNVDIRETEQNKGLIKEIMERKFKHHKNEDE